MRREVVEAGSLGGAVGAALTSAAAGLCCIGPLALTLLGVNGMILAAGLKPYRFHLHALSSLMLALAFWTIYRPVRGPALACPTGTGRVTRVVLWFASVVWIVALVLQFVADKITV